MSLREATIILKRGEILRVVGPARLEVDGRVLVSGVEVENASLVVQSERGVSLYATGEAKVRISSGSRASHEIVRDDNLFGLAEQWVRVIDDVRERGLRRLLVVAPVESGKSTFSLWAANRLGVCYASLDPGQNELGTPCFLSAAKPGFALTTLDLKPSWAWLVGSNAPEHSPWLSVSAAVRLSRFLGSRCGGFVGDTDGFVEGAGVVHKEALMEAMEVDAVVVMRRGPWRKYVQIARAYGLEVVEVEPVPERLVRGRSRSERRAYRERMYRRLFERAPKMEVKLDEAPLLNAEILEAPRLPVALSMDTSTLYVDYRGVLKRVPRGWERGLIASLVVDEGFEVPALVESLNTTFNTIVVRVAWEPEGKVTGVKLGYVRLVEWKEERVRHTLHPAAR